MVRPPVMTISAAALLCAGLAAGALAAKDRSPHEPHGVSGKQCFFLSEVSGFNAAGRDRIMVNVGAGKRYLFRTLGSCPDIDFTENIGFDQRPGGGTICDGMDVDLIVLSTIGPRRCPVAMIRQLAPGEKPEKHP